MSASRSPMAEVPVETSGREGGAQRIGEDRAAKILERAAALDAKRSSEIEIDQLREAAAAAGISREAFDEAMVEAGEDAIPPKGAGTAPRSLPAPRAGGERTLGTADVAYYAALLRDVLGDEGRVTVAEGCMQWSDEDGLIVSVSPSPSGATAAITSEGRLQRRLLAIFLPVLVPLVIAFTIALQDGDAIVAFFGMLIALVAALIGTAVSHHRERRALRRKAERIRRQLQRLLAPAPERP